MKQKGRLFWKWGRESEEREKCGQGKRVKKNQDMLYTCSNSHKQINYYVLQTYTNKRKERKRKERKEGAIGDGCK